MLKMDCEKSTRLQMEEKYRNILQVSEQHKTNTRDTLRNKLKSLQFHRSSRNGLNPLLLLPEEIWKMILNCVDDPCDLISCAQTCQLFSRLLGIQKENLLFVKVFPSLEKYLAPNFCRYDLNFRMETRDPIKTCSEVSKFWHAAVRKFSEQSYAAEATCSDIVEKVFKDPLTFSDTDSVKRNHTVYIPTEEPLQYMRLQNPINTSYLEKLVRLRINESTDFFIEYSDFLKNQGKDLLHLDLYGDYDACISPSSFYMVCQKALQFCPNLKSLQVSSWNGITWTEKVEDISNAVNRKAALCEHIWLESVSFIVESTKSICIQDKIISQYCQQLKRVEVNDWNFEMYSDLSWNNLKQLSVLSANTEQLLTSLLKMEADELCVLKIRLDQSNHSLETLIRVINSFPKLRKLQLSIAFGFTGWSDQEILDLHTELVARNLTSELGINSEEPEMCHNFLVCFPALEKIVFSFGNKVGLSEKVNKHADKGSPECYIRNDPVFLGEEEPDLVIREAEEEEDENINMEDVYKYLAGESDEDKEENGSMEENSDDDSQPKNSDDDSDDDNKENDNDSSSSSVDSFRYDSHIKPPTENDFIQISKFMWKTGYKPDEINRLYQSNIWEHLKSLKVVEMSRLEVNMLGPISKAKVLVCTRQGYEYWKNKNVFMDRHLRSIQQMHAAQELEKIKTFHKKHSKRSHMSAPRKRSTRKSVCESTKIGFDTVLPFVALYLETSTIKTCRLVCKDWALVVDRFLKDNPFKIMNQFLIPFNNSKVKSMHNKHLSQLENHPSAVGGSVEKILNHPTRNCRKLLIDLLKLLSTTCRNMVHLRVISNVNAVPIDVDVYYKICKTISENCSQIQSLSLWDVAVCWPERYMGFILGELPTFERITTLDSLAINTSDQLHNDLKNRLFVAETIKHLKTNCWYSRDFPNLKKLQVGKLLYITDLSEQHKLTKFSAPNLRHLSFYLHYCCSVRDLFTIISRFPQLDVLEMKICDGFYGLRCDTLTSMDPRVIFSVRDFMVVVTDKYRVCLDFLLHFPNLRSLKIVYGNGAAKAHDIEEEEPGLRLDSDDLQAYETDRKPEEDCIQLAKFVSMETQEVAIKDSVYYSNVWKNFPKLERVLVEECTEVKDKVVKNSYTRLGYQDFISGKITI